MPQGIRLLWQRSVGQIIYLGLVEPCHVPACRLGHRRPSQEPAQIDPVLTHDQLVDSKGILVEEDKLSKAIDKYSEANDTTFADLGDDDGLEDLDFVSTDEENKGPNEDDVNDTPIVKFVNKVLMDAIKSGASDIHMEPYEKSFRVRFRRD